MPLIADEPPSTRPRGHGMTVPVALCTTLTPAQSTAVPCTLGHPVGTATASSGSRLPASISSTRTSGFSDNRAATTQPAVPAPTTT